jgi:hypothetical protein
MIKDIITELKSVDSHSWGIYTFKRDPVERKVTDKEKEEIIEKANECGRIEAASLKGKYGSKSCREYAENLGITITESNDESSRDYILFAKFNAPDKITVYMNNVRKTEEIVKKENLNRLLDGVKIDDVLIAHEMFHFIENSSKDIYTRRKKIRLWKLGPIVYNSGLVAAGEIAAMAFARELLGLSYYPNLFDILLLLPHDEKKAVALYKEVHDLKGVE